LKVEPKSINIGDLIRSTETDFFMVECFDRINNKCPLTSSCLLKTLLRRATDAYLAILDSATLDELIVESGTHTDRYSSAHPIRIRPSPGKSPR